MIRRVFMTGFLCLGLSLALSTESIADQYPGNIEGSMCKLSDGSSYPCSNGPYGDPAVDCTETGSSLHGDCLVGSEPGIIQQGMLEHFEDQILSITKPDGTILEGEKARDHFRSIFLRKAVDEK